MSERQTLLRLVQECDFALHETALYLNSHPEDTNALEFFKRHRTMREQYVNEFVKNYGPLTHLDYNGGPRWEWVDGPWPWHNEEA